MRTHVPEKLLKIVDDIDADGDANLTRLTVLKKWFNTPGRLVPFALWIASRASSRKGKTKGEAAELFREARTLLVDIERHHPKLDRPKAERLHARLADFQNKYRNVHWARVRIINNWQLLLVEKGLAIALGHDATPSAGYKLAADYCQHYDAKYGNTLNGPSSTKIMEIIRFMFSHEALEETDWGQS